MLLTHPFTSLTTHASPGPTPCADWPDCVYEVTPCVLTPIHCPMSYAQFIQLSLRHNNASTQPPPTVSQSLYTTPTLHIDLALNQLPMFFLFVGLAVLLLHARLLCKCSINLPHLLSIPFESRYELGNSDAFRYAICSAPPFVTDSAHSPLQTQS